MNNFQVGRIARAARRRQGLRQDELAALASVGNRFVSELENGKPGLEFGRVLRVLSCLGLELRIGPRGWEDIEHDERL